MLPCLLVTLAGLASDVDRLSAWDSRYYRALVPAEGELKWKQIAWQADLAAAVKLATAEKRPLLLWVAGDPPLERC